MKMKICIVTMLMVVSTALQAAKVLKIEKVIARKNVQTKRVSYEIH